MFSKWGNWLGIQDQNVQDKQENETSTGVIGDESLEVNKPLESERGAQPQLLQQAKGFSGEHCY